MQASADKPESIDRLDRVVCIESRVPSQPNTGKLCSAFFVEAESRLFLVTAGHAAIETSADSRVKYRDPKGASQWVTLKLLIVPSKSPWQRDPTSDFAIAEIVSNEANAAYISHFRAMSVSLESLATTSPSRTTAVVTLGFPLGIGSRDEISPLAVIGHISSREILTDNSWGQEPIIFSGPALAQGTSGGPTFRWSDDDTLSVIGMYVGVVNDASGAKLSKLVPARLIRDRISELITDPK